MSRVTEMIEELQRLTKSPTGNVMLDTIRSVQYRAARTRERTLGFDESNLAGLIAQIRRDITDPAVADTLVFSANAIADQVDDAHASDIRDRDEGIARSAEESQKDDACRHGKLYSEKCSECENEEAN